MPAAGSVGREAMYKNRFSRKTDSLLANRSSGNPICYTENQFSGKTYFYTLASGSPSRTTWPPSRGRSGRKGRWRGGRGSFTRRERGCRCCGILYTVRHLLISKVVMDKIVDVVLSIGCGCGGCNTGNGVMG